MLEANRDRDRDRERATYRDERLQVRVQLDVVSLVALDVVEEVLQLRRDGEGGVVSRVVPPWDDLGGAGCL